MNARSYENSNLKFATKEQATRFFAALDNDDFDAFQHVVRENREILNWERRDCKTPLHHAAGVPSLKIAEFLLDELGYDVNVLHTDRPNSEYVPLHDAAYTGDLAMVMELVERGAKVNAGRGLHDTPLHGTAWHDKADIAQYLIDHGADLNNQDHEGLTPLARAIQQKSRKVEELLRTCGAELRGMPIKRAVRAPRRIDLPKHRSRIERIITRAIKRYAKSKDAEPTTVCALHLSAHTGYIGVCFETGPFDGDVPSMNYFQFETEDFPQWQAAYEQRDSVAIVTYDGREISVPTEQSDEVFEKPFFTFIAHVLKTMGQTGKLDLLPRAKGFKAGVECVGGEYTKFWEVRQASKHT